MVANSNAARDVPQGRVVAVEEVPQSPDRLIGLLRFGILFIIVTILSLVLYGLLAGVFMPPAPRTRAEDVLARTAAEVKAKPKDGKAWADYAEALYATGSKDEAREVLKQARKNVKSRSIREVNNAEVHLLILDGKNAEALKLSTEYIQIDFAIRSADASANAQKLISVPLEAYPNGPTITSFILRATAETNLKKYKDAVADYGNALVLDPQAADVQIMRGWARIAAGDKKGAKQDFEQGLRFLPDDPSGRRGLEALKSAETTKSK